MQYDWVNNNNNNNNNAIVNNSYAKPQDLTLLLKIRMGTRKYFFVVYRQFGHAPPQRFARTGLYTVATT